MDEGVVQLALRPIPFLDETSEDFLATIRSLTRLATEGADILDIGGESTRPGATPGIRLGASPVRLPLRIETPKLWLSSTPGRPASVMVGTLGNSSNSLASDASPSVASP